MFGSSNPYGASVGNDMSVGYKPTTAWIMKLAKFRDTHCSAFGG